MKFLAKNIKKLDKEVRENLGSPALAGLFGLRNFTIIINPIVIIRVGHPWTGALAPVKVYIVPTTNRDSW